MIRLIQLCSSELFLNVPMRQMDDGSICSSQRTGGATGYYQPSGVFTSAESMRASGGSSSVLAGQKQT